MAGRVGDVPAGSQTGWRGVTTWQWLLDQQRKGEKNQKHHGWEQNLSMKQLWWDRWKEREVSTGGQKLDGGLHRSLQDLQKRQPVGRRGLNRHDREGRGHQTGREDRSPGSWDGGAQLF